MKRSEMVKKIQETISSAHNAGLMDEEIIADGVLKTIEGNGMLAPCRYGKVKIANSEETVDTVCYYWEDEDA